MVPSWLITLTAQTRDTDTAGATHRLEHFASTGTAKHPRAACESEVVSLGDLLSSQRCRQSEVVDAKTGVEGLLFVFPVAHVLVVVVFLAEPGVGTALIVQVWEGNQGLQD